MLTRIRDNLAILFAIAACIFAAYAYIGGLKADILEQQNINLQSRNETLVNAADTQAKAISGLMEQRIIDEQVVTALNKQREILRQNTNGIRAKLKELEENDKQIQDLLNIELPDDVVRLLEQGAIDGYKYGSEGVVSAAKPTTTLPSTTTEGSGEQ